MQHVKKPYFVIRLVIYFHKIHFNNPQLDNGPAGPLVKLVNHIVRTYSVITGLEYRFTTHLNYVKNRCLRALNLLKDSDVI